MTDPQVLLQAVEYLNDNQPERAEEICRALLLHEPENAKAWHLCGISLAQRNALQPATECFQNSTIFDRTNALYHYNLARAYSGLGQLDSAIESYRQAIANNADFLEPRLNLANVLIESGDNEGAIECFRELLKLFPDSSDSHYNFANLLQDIGKLDQAIEHYHRSIELNPRQSAARENLGRAHSDVGRLQEAQQVWCAWLEFEPDNAVARHMVASTTGKDVPDRCDDDFIRETFNEDFSKSFDRQLARIEYRAPQLVGDVVKAISHGKNNLDVLDAGCGTGLCAPFVRAIAGHLVGVDLSENMLTEARKRQEYDELTACELTQFMDAHPSSFDLIVSADTLCYFGRLNPVLAAAHCSLKGEGFLIFTVEQGLFEDPAQDFELGYQGRYRHSEEYVRQALVNSGFSSIDIAHEALRRERGRIVSGLLVSACRKT